MNMLRDRCALLSLVSATAMAAGTVPHAFAQLQSPAHSTSHLRISTRAGAEHVLRSRVTLNVVDAGLSDVLAHIESVTPIRFEPVWNDGHRAGLDPSTLITLDLNNRPIYEVLQRLLEQIGDDYDHAAWQIGNDGRVQIGPKLRLNERTTVVIFDLHDVIFSIPDYIDVPEIDIQAAMQQDSGSASVPFQDISDDVEPESAVRDAADIAELITLFVEPEQWQRNGGEGALMRIWNNHLIVRAPRYVLRGIEGLL